MERIEGLLEIYQKLMEIHEDQQWSGHEEGAEDQWEESVEE